MAMTRALATTTVTGSSIKPSATPTLLHKMTPPSLGPGLVMRPTPVHSSVTSTSTDIPQDVLQRATKTRAHRLVVFGSVIAGVIFLGLTLFLLLDPRMMRKLCGDKVDDNLPPSKQFYHRPAWNVSPISSSDFLYIDDAPEKTFFTKKNPGDAIIEVLPKQPTSKFSVCSSEYSVSEDDTPKSPVRPPRPPTADSPTLSESVYLACADQPYIIVPPQPFTGIDHLDSAPATPTGQKILTPREFFNMYSQPASDDSNSSATLSCAQSNTPPELRDTRHSRTHSAPLFGRSTNDKIIHIPEPTVVRRLLKHRKSRSASGWAYPNRLPWKGPHNSPYFSSRR